MNGNAVGRVATHLVLLVAKYPFVTLHYRSEMIGSPSNLNASLFSLLQS